jgi:hypothetical protein
MIMQHLMCCKQHNTAQETRYNHHMQAIQITTSELLSNYISNMLEVINDDHGSPEDMSFDIINLADDLRQLNNKCTDAAVSAYRRMFRDGFTVQLLPAAIFDQIEALHDSSQEFVLLLNNAQGDHIGVVAGKDINW